MSVQFLSTNQIYWYIPVIIMMLVCALSIVLGFALYKVRINNKTYSRSNKASVEDEKSFNCVSDLSKIGVEQSVRFNVPEDIEGTEVVGIIYNTKSKLVMIHPNGKKVKVGDVVKVLDLGGTVRMVPVVLANKKVPNELINQAVHEIIEVVYTA